MGDRVKKTVSSSNKSDGFCVNLNINVNLNICKNQNAEIDAPDMAAKSAKEKPTQPKEENVPHPLLNISGTKSSVNFYKEKNVRRRLSNFSRPKLKQSEFSEYANHLPVDNGNTQFRNP